MIIDDDRPKINSILLEKNGMEPTIEQLMAHDNGAWRLCMETALTLNSYKS